MKVMKSTSLLFSLGAATLLVLAGCTKKLDMGGVNTALNEGLASELGITDAVLTCPSEAPPAKAGESFECEAKPKEGGRLVLQVTQKDDKGSVSWELVKVENMIDLLKTEQSVGAALKEQSGADVTVTCMEEGGSRLRPAKAGETFECQAATADGTTHPLLLTMKDDQGNVSWSVEPSGDATEEPSEEPTESAEPEAE